MTAAHLVRVATFFTAAWACLLNAHAEPTPSIELHLVDGETGKPVDGAIAIGYWSKNPPADLACNAGALFGLPVHCGGIPIVFEAVEARSDESGQVNLPDPERRGGKPTAAHWLRVVIFKDGYWTEAVGRNDWYEPRNSSCIAKQERPRNEVYTRVLVFPLLSECQIYRNPASANERSEAERRWDSADVFASSIEDAVKHAEDRYTIAMALRGSIAAVDPILLNARPPTRRFSAWETEQVLAIVRQLRGQPKYRLQIKRPGPSPQGSVEVGAP